MIWIWLVGGRYENIFWLLMVCVISLIILNLNDPTTTKYPTLEYLIKASVDSMCFDETPSASIKTGGFINLETKEIWIDESLDEELKIRLMMHEECHKRQIEAGLYDNLTCEEDYDKLIGLERECKYIERGITDE